MYLSLKILCIYVIELVGDALINDYMSFFSYSVFVTLVFFYFCNLKKNCVLYTRQN
jgi:hypothetical protein